MALTFLKNCESIGIQLTNTMMNQFETYYDYLISQNEVMNLTAITDKEEVFLKHFFDSLWLTKVGSFDNVTLLDVGSGAGFPSLPLKIINPSIKVTIVDALQKRIDFLKRLSDKLSINDNKLIHGRIEEFIMKNYFNYVTARAVARLNILTELCLPFVKVGGKFIAMKSINYEEELEEAKHAIDKLGGVLEEVIEYPLEDGLNHVLIIIKKVRNTTDFYPRSFSLIKKKPL
ncbi:MAG: 16S rRNA (guanine(527)-N(7))-methyltransferase RsmG [Tenericutes bacterium HGW-Tenericutes-1]|nr:MAG: 16S rRNA (guanine(527)-N(7))-methyltransferase RsmG [Tenericutes bacterium HGW-Tenericutes-1]